MRKEIIYLTITALLAGTACTSTETATDITTTATADPATAVRTNPVGPGGRDPLTSDYADMSDPMFVIDAASSSMMEMQLGEMAVQKANNAQVKKFAQMMIEHHSRANNELKTVAAQLNITLPTALTQEHQAIVDLLKTKTGTEFDESYMDAMEAAHKVDIAKFDLKSTNAANGLVKAFATKTLPLLREHLNMATKLEDMVD